MKKDEEFIALLKSTVKENKLDTIPDSELIEIHNRAKLFALNSNELDFALSKAVNALSGEIKKREIPKAIKPQEDKPQEIYSYEDSSARAKEDACPACEKKYYQTSTKEIIGNHKTICMILLLSLILVMGALFFQYDEEFIQGRPYRYNRFTMTVQQKSGTEWVPIQQFKNLQHVRDFLAKRERNRQSETIEDLKDTVETMKMDQENREIYRRD
jgi:hypothetical protein